MPQQRLLAHLPLHQQGCAIKLMIVERPQRASPHTRIEANGCHIYCAMPIPCTFFNCVWNAQLQLRIQSPTNEQLGYLLEAAALFGSIQFIHHPFTTAFGWLFFFQAPHSCNREGRCRRSHYIDLPLKFWFYAFPKKEAICVRSSGLQDRGMVVSLLAQQNAQQIDGTKKHKKNACTQYKSIPVTH